ncbi:MAG TPA: ATP-binding protein [Caulobacteraceae bacterium]|nr:ATP-binding protein [Caulobacteraceae bacterium]
MVALGSALLLMLAGIGAALYGEQLYRTQKVREATVQAQILAATVTAAVAFDDTAAAQEYVNALRANPEVEAAGVYDENGLLVAGYNSGQGMPLPRRLTEVSDPFFERGHLIITTPVVEGATRIGAVQLRNITEPVARRVTRYGAATLLVGMAALVVAVLGAAQAALTRANRELRRQARDLADANEELRVQIAEREKAEEALRQSQKMEAIGQLTGGVAHDFNNLLMVASSGLDLMERTSDPARRDLLKNSIRQAVDRGSSLTRQLLAFSRPTAQKPQVIDLGAQIEGMQVLLERSLREDIEVELKLPKGVWPVEVDPNQLEVALLNMAVNARDAMPSGGKIIIAAENRSGMAEGALRGDYVQLCVTDTGKGMTPELINRVFEPFFTTKERGQGTGLGLSQVYGFARASGGEVRIESEVDSGTTISIYLPRQQKPLSELIAEEAQPAAIPRGRGKVLLVEDDEAVAALVDDMLRELGYQPTHVANAMEALKALEAGKFDLVFSDMVMPGEMDGLGLARRIIEAYPDLPVVLTTGFSEAAAAANEDGIRLLVKPYRIEQLAAELAAARAGVRA